MSEKNESVLPKVAGLLIFRYIASGDVQFLLAKRKETTKEESRFATTIQTHLRADEAPQQAMERIVRQSIGLDVREYLLPKGTTVHDHDGCTYYTYLATPLQNIAGADMRLEGHDDVEFLWVARRDLLNHGLHPSLAEYFNQYLSSLIPPDVAPEVVKDYVVTL
ncbi:hypothetical protein F5Y11DRAFT_56998 [Daldinia sp. FL1419]|nr:hypothetical protein F5Y11DRAFT_56998 [Daldinia sp. FL1419]